MAMKMKALAKVIPDQKGLIALIKMFGFFQLAGTDGCWCSNLLLQGIHVDVSCAKCSDTNGIVIRVYSNYLEQHPIDFLIVAEAVAEELAMQCDLPIEIRLWELRYDRSCRYCGVPLSSYGLCDAHMNLETRYGRLAPIQYKMGVQSETPVLGAVGQIERA